MKKNDSSNISFSGVSGILIGFVPWVLGWIWIILSIAGWVSG